MNRTRIAWAVAFIVGAFALVIIVTAIIVSATKSTDSADTSAEIRQAQVTNTKTIENTAETLKLIRDCTQPEGECYKRGQASTADAVDNIGLLSAYAAACADQPDQQTADEIQACVLKLLDRPRTKR